MTTLMDLYNVRQTIVQNRQKKHLPQYAELDKFLRKLEKTEAYSLDFDSRMKFEELRFFVTDTFGQQAKIPGEDDYIYRVCRMIDIVEGCDWYDDEGSEAANWKQVQQKARGGWVSLSKLGSGKYKCKPRRFSWWTSFPLFQDVISGAHRIGITSDWVAVQCVVLRCSSEYVKSNNLAFVPTVIDAFMQSIFHPTRDVNTNYGITIDLSLFPLTLSPGIDEVLLPEIGVEQIEVFAVNADEDYRKGKTAIRSDSSVLSALLEYYYRNL